ncbi:MAG: hypothetical protein R2741_03345 [Methanolobus sp.]
MVNGSNSEFQGILFQENITKRKNIRQEQEDYELVFRQAIEFSPQAIAILDSDLNPVYLNRKVLIFLVTLLRMFLTWTSGGVSPVPILNAINVFMIRHLRKNSHLMKNKILFTLMN